MLDATIVLFLLSDYEKYGLAERVSTPLLWRLERHLLCGSVCLVVRVLNQKEPKTPLFYCLINKQFWLRFTLTIRKRWFCLFVSLLVGYGLVYGCRFAIILTWPKQSFFLRTNHQDHQRQLQQLPLLVPLRAVPKGIRSHVKTKMKMKVMTMCVSNKRAVQLLCAVSLVYWNVFLSSHGID